jgi:amidohydrolase
MGGEDFAYYERRIPGLFFNFGIEGPQPLHHPAFVANPAFLSQASALLAGLARGRLKG